ncbi:MAG: aldo/keto reductase [Rhodospirillaceae bacterium]|jgi:pyridoxine 4-dehydrogenase|nr:aldo/keto reductase [Rhodospirillaceae bacterium]MBT6430082.1 aldo/keto reductase [Rhodospirillaceae bacterium]
MVDTLHIGDREVPRIGFGTLYITEQRGFGPYRSNAIELLREARNLGVRFFDSADSYGNGAAEDAIHDALYPYEGFLIATKGGYRHDRLGAWSPDARPEQLRAALEGSLRRLHLESVDLYQLHCADGRVPYEDSVGALVDMQKEGKIRHVGVSNVGVSEIEIARRLTPVVSVQNAFNVRQQGNSQVLDYCTANAIAFIPWMPLGDGGLSWDDPDLQRLATKYEVTAPQIALAALLHRSPIMLPIPGTSSLAHLRDNCASGNLGVDSADLAVFWQSR